MRDRFLFQRLRPLSTALAITCLGPCVLQAQDAPNRPAINRLRATLDTAQTLASVDAIAAAWNLDGEVAVGRLASAYIELRRGVLTNSRLALTSAWTRFDQVVRIHPDWPYARLGLAVAALEIYSRRYPLPADYDDVAGGTHYDGYAIQMKRTLRSEPTFQPAINWLAGTLSEEGDRDQPGAILEALQYIADSTNSRDPRVQLILARAERLHGDARQSVPRIDAYLREGGDAGVAEIELARSFAWMGELANAAAEYMAGAAVQTEEARAIYRLDMSWVATPRELAQYDSLPVDSVAAFIERFWDKRDVQELRPEGSRLQEHLRRWVYVSQNFRVPDPGRRTAYRDVFIPYNGQPCSEQGPNSLDDYNYTEPARLGGYRSPERVFDHRAIVYMRHGQPLYALGGYPETNGLQPVPSINSSLYSRYDPVNQVSLAAPATTQQNRTQDPSVLNSGPLVAPDRNTTWVYLIGGQLRAFTFLGSQALGSNSPSTLIVSSPPNLNVLQQLSALSSSYARLAGVVQWDAAFGGSVTPTTCQRAYLDVVSQQREDAAVAISTDTYLRRFSKPLTTAIQLSTVGQPADGTGLLLAALAIKTGELTTEPVADDTSMVQFSVQVQMAAIDSVTGESVRMDTVRQFTQDRREMAQGNMWVSFLMRLPIPPGLREVRLSVEQDDDRGSVFGSAIVPATAGFSASDIVLGSGHGSIAWKRNGSTVQVSPFSFYTVGDSLPLYYELYGLTSGTEYRTVLSLRKEGDKKAVSSVSFRDTPTGTQLDANRTLTLTDVKPGQHRLTVTVREMSTGREIERQRTITVEGP
jgi:GWxTD domain-containing protein